MEITLVLLSSGLIGYAIGFFTSIEFKLALDHIRNTIRLKLLPRHEAVVNTLSQDTQIVLRQYMEQVDYYGQTVYAVRDVKSFDKLLKHHRFNNFDSGVEQSDHEVCKCRGCDLNKCISRCSQKSAPLR